MKKIYKINEVKIENDYLILVIDNQLFRFNLSEISNKLEKASDIERQDYRISPSGYGIHWKSLDEDLSIAGLLNKGRSKQRKQLRISQ